MGQDLILMSLFPHTPPSVSGVRQERGGYQPDYLKPPEFILRISIMSLLGCSKMRVSLI